VINSTNFFKVLDLFFSQFFYIKNLKKETKKNPGLVFLFAIFFPQFCDVGEVVVIHKLIYNRFGYKNMKLEIIKHPFIYLATYYNLLHKSCNFGTIL
jgi:hypothetical protein